MAKRADHTFYCERCKSACMIYKKGRKHRVLVCPQCGVLATNGFLAGLGKAAMKIGKSVPILGTVLSAGEAVGDIYSAVKGDSTTKPPSPQNTPLAAQSYRRQSSYPTHQKVHDALR